MVEGSAGADRAAESGSSSAATPLELIRQKEGELSGRVLGAKREADEIVADARKQAAVIIETATEESIADARERTRKAIEDSEARAKMMLGEATSEAEALVREIEPRLQEAVDFVVGSVTTI